MAEEERAELLDRARSILTAADMPTELPVRVGIGLTALA
jgi:hypothetical protein